MTLRQRTLPSATRVLLLLLLWASNNATAFTTTPSSSQQQQHKQSLTKIAIGYYDQGWKDIPDPVLSSSSVVDPVTTTTAAAAATKAPAATHATVSVSQQLQESAHQIASSIQSAAASASSASQQQQPSQFAASIVDTTNQATSKLASLQSAAQASTRAAQDKLSTVNLESSARAVLENARALQMSSAAPSVPRDPSPAFSLPEPMPLPHADFDTILANAPDTPGLAQPMVQYVMDTLYAAKDSPLNPPNLFANAAGVPTTPVDYETVALGLQVKSDFLHSLQHNSQTAQDAAHYFTSNLATSYDKSSHTLHAMADTAQHTAADWSDYVGTNAAQSYASYGAPAVLAAQTATRALQHSAAVTSQEVSSKAMASAATAAAQGFSPLAQATRQTAQYVTEQLEQLVASMSISSSGSSTTTAALAAASSSDKLLAGAALGLVVLVTLVQQQQNNTKLRLSPAVGKQKKMSLSSMRGGPNNNNDDVVDSDKLEGVVADLTQAVAILANELKDIKQQSSSSMQGGDDESVNDPAVAAKLMELEAQNVALRSQLNAAQFEVETLAEVNVRTCVVVCVCVSFVSSSSSLSHTVPHIRTSCTHTRTPLQEALNIGADAIQSMTSSPKKAPTPPATGPDKNLANAYFVLANGLLNGGGGGEAAATTDSSPKIKRKRTTSSQRTNEGGLAEQQS